TGGVAYVVSPLTFAMTTLRTPYPINNFLAVDLEMAKK
ncbi:MAG: hypothetical protein ACI9MB_003376, partial [Verrucomicrobiales bacterium]